MLSWKPSPALAGPLYGKDPWPLRFHTHNFSARCFNTQACSLIYNNYQFGTQRFEYDLRYYDQPSGPPYAETWKDDWTGNHTVLPDSGGTFPGPVAIDWIAMDGSHLQTSIDLDSLFNDRLILHRVPRAEVKELWLEAKSINPIRPSILVEVNDRTIRIYMRAIVATEAEQIPGNPNSHFRDDLMLAWSHRYLVTPPLSKKHSLVWNRTHLSVDDVPSDGVGHELLTAEQLSEFWQARNALSRFLAPLLVRADNASERLFIAAFGGIGNDKRTAPKHAPNVAKITNQVEQAMKSGNTQIHVHYVAGPGTQTNILKAALGGMTGYTYGENIHGAYKELVAKANRWFRLDPATIIRVQSIGFSRGGSQAAGLTRLLHKKGIPDLSREEVNDIGEITYTHYHIAPGEVVQTVCLFDPVAIGVPTALDRRLPPSVMSGFQITAMNDWRALYPSDHIIPHGLSDDGRFLNVMVPGAHTDVGGGYARYGVSVRCGNLMVDYCNSASDVPFLQKEYEPVDRRFNVIHRSTGGMPIYRMDPLESVRNGIRWLWRQHICRSRTRHR